VSGSKLGSIRSILEGIEALDPEKRGRVSFGAHGAVLVESQRICWATAAGMQRRITDMLRQQRSPPLTRSQMEDVLETCRREGIPFGQGFVGSGLVSEAGLRMALLRNAAEAIAHLALARAVQTAFVAHSSAPYDPRFSFSTVEILAELGARRDRVDAAVSRSELSGPALADRDCFAFVRPVQSSSAVIIAVRNCRQRRVRELMDAAACATSAFDVSEALAARTSSVSAELPEGEPFVAWRAGETYHLVFCEDAPSAEWLLDARMDRTAG
jgi:hypothetical protein